MSKPRFTEEFKLEAIKQITEHQRPVAEVDKRLEGFQSLRAEVKRLTEERDLLEKTVVDSTCQRVKVRYRFIKSHAHRYPVRQLHHVLQVRPSRVRG